MLHSNKLDNGHYVEYNITVQVDKYNNQVFYFEDTASRNACKQNLQECIDILNNSTPYDVTGSGFGEKVKQYFDDLISNGHTDGWEISTIIVERFSKVLKPSTSEVTKQNTIYNIWKEVQHILNTTY